MQREILRVVIMPGNGTNAKLQARFWLGPSYRAKGCFLGNQHPFMQMYIQYACPGPLLGQKTLYTER